MLTMQKLRLAAWVFGGLGCVSAVDSGERYEFLSGEAICIESDRVVDQTVSASFGADHGLTSLSVNVDSAIVQMAPDRSLNAEYLHDLAGFMRENPALVTVDKSSGFLRLNASLRPAAEVDSMRLRDRLLPGDGSLSFVVSRSIANLAVAKSVGEQELQDTFMAICFGEQRCDRMFPFAGFRVTYPLPAGWENGVTDFDVKLRQLLGSIASAC